jgi:hypothetical protein
MWGDEMLIKDVMQMNKSTIQAYGVRWKLVTDETKDYYFPCDRLSLAKGKTPTDFDSIAPWSGMKLCNINAGVKTYSDEAGYAVDGSNGDVFVEIPKHYICRYQAGGYEYRFISPAPLSGFIVDPAFVENGVELDYIYVSAYEGYLDGSNKLKSISGVYPTADKTRAQYRTYAQANGSNYGILDIRTLMMLQNLFLIEHANKDSQATVGNGWGKLVQPNQTNRNVLAETGVNRIVSTTFGVTSQEGMFIGSAITITSYADSNIVYYTGRSLTNIVADSPAAGQTSLYFDGAAIDTTLDMCIGGAAQKTGIADAVTGHTGHSEFMGTGTLTSYRCAVKYRNMENLWGNLWHFIDGLNLANGVSYYCENMADYVSGVTTGAYKSAAISQELQPDNGDIGGDLEIHYTKNLGFNPDKPWLGLPKDFTYEGQSSVPGASPLLRNGNFGDYYYLNNAGQCYVHGGGFDHYWRCGLFTMRGWILDSLHWYLYGARLIYKPIS